MTARAHELEINREVGGIGEFESWVCSCGQWWAMDTLAQVVKWHRIHRRGAQVEAV